MSTTVLPVESARDSRRVIAAAASLAFALLLVRTAWLDDDAYITFRTVDNFLNGYGLRWNIANRVQAYTHPLWMFAMSGAAAITGEVYYTAIALSIGLSLGSFALVATRVARAAPTALLAVSVLALSKAFVDYSTSGLENPLTHLLLVAFFLVLTSSAPDRRRLLRLSALAALVMVNRIDIGLLVLPALGVSLWRAGVARSWQPVALGMAPLVLWEAFSLVYYGFPFPNTAYSKLQHGVPRPELLAQGAMYVLDSLANDPITLLVIGGALLSPAGRSAGGRSFRVGIALYLVYIVWVGGDFMSGRFLTAPLLVAVMQLARMDVPRFSPAAALALGLVWLTGLTAPRPTVFSNAAYGADIEPARVIAPTGITDERRYYYPQAGLLTAQRGVAMPNHKWLYMGFDAAARGDRVLTTDAAGFIGYAAGPGVYFVDKYGLGDPLIARLPAEAPWRMGHFVRTVPEGYLESIAAGRNVIRDTAVAAYYERIKLITEGPLWSRARWRAIAGMQTGRYDHLIESYGVVRRSLEELQEPKMNGTDWNLASNAVLTFRGLDVAMAAEVVGQGLELSVSRNDRYDIQLLRAGQVVHEARINPRMQADSSLVTHRIDLPRPASFDRIRVRPSKGDARYSVGHLLVLP